MFHTQELPSKLPYLTNCTATTLHQLVPRLYASRPSMTVGKEDRQAQFETKPCSALLFCFSKFGGRDNREIFKEKPNSFLRPSPLLTEQTNVESHDQQADLQL
jgi:hypothetical protein